MASFQLLAAGWRNDAIHAQVFDHLSVVIVGVGHRVDGKLNTRVLLRRAEALRQHGRDRVFCGYRRRGSMQRSERAFEVVKDFRL